ncbi:MAG TPA: serine hydrolase [Chitinophagales bacterium]|nr:serine hydrolase [Chitinophagales bacterium]
MRNIAIWIVAILSCTSLSMAGDNISTINKRATDIFDWSEANYTKESISKIDEYYTSLHNRGVFNGNILIAHKGQPIYQKSLGYAVKSTGEKLTSQSTFQLASTSKPFTATAILILHERGQLDIDDVVSKYFPDFPYKRVTIRHLLSHRSGIPDYMKLGSFFNQKFISNEDVMQMFARHRPRALHSANGVFKYNNSNYVVLAALVEKISGDSFADFLHDNIFRPLGMNSTWVWHPTQKRKKGQTYGYNRSWVPRTPDKYNGTSGDKGIYSTAEDLLKWDLAWHNCNLLKEETILDAYEEQSPRVNDRNYGLGWRTKQLEGGKKMIYHNGWWNDYNIVFKRFIDDELTIIILSNKYNRSVYDTEFAESLLFRESEPQHNESFYADNVSIGSIMKEQAIPNLTPFNYSPESETASTASADDHNTPTYYTVKRGDTLYQIAQKFNLSVSRLKQLNKIVSTKILLGQRLVIY